jgi:hypothetical protein
MKGMAVCSTHGGKSPNALAGAARRLAEEKALSLLNISGRSQPVTDPISTLMDLAGEALAFKEILSEHVATLTEMRYRGKSGEQIRGELEAYERALDRAEHFCNNLAKLNLEERQLKINQAHVELTVTALDASMAAVGIEGEQRDALLREMARRLGDG